MCETIRVVLADGSVPARVGVRHILERAGGYAIVGETGSGIRVLELVEEQQPDIVLLDIYLHDFRGTQIMAELHQRQSPARVLALASDENDEDILRMIECGAAGYVLKDEAPEKIIEAVRTVTQGSVWFSPRVMEHVAAWLHQPPSHRLSGRETEVLRLAARGLTDKEIGKELNIAHPTVRFHLRQVSDKLGIRGKGRLIAWAFENGVARANIAKRVLREAIGEYRAEKKD